MGWCVLWTGKYGIFSLCTLRYCIWIFSKWVAFLWTFCIGWTLKQVMSTATSPCQLKYPNACHPPHIICWSYGKEPHVSLLSTTFVLPYKTPLMCQPTQIAHCFHKLSEPLFWWMEWLGDLILGSYCSLGMMQAQF
jgi:hypothetical protein